MNLFSRNKKPMKVYLCCYMNRGQIVDCFKIFDKENKAEEWLKHAQDAHDHGIADFDNVFYEELEVK